MHIFKSLLTCITLYFNWDIKTLNPSRSPLNLHYFLKLNTASFANLSN